MTANKEGSYFKCSSCRKDESLPGSPGHVICLSGAHTEDEESLKIIENFLIALKGRQRGSLFQTNTREDW